MSRIEDPFDELWNALAEVNPFDRGSLAVVFLGGTAVGWWQGLGLLAPFYGLLEASLMVALVWAIRLNARARRK